MRYQALIDVRDGFSMEKTLDIEDLEFSGKGVKVTYREGGTKYIHSEKIRELINLETGEVYENPTYQLIIQILESRRDEKGKLLISDLMDALPFSGVGPVTSISFNKFANWSECVSCLRGVIKEVGRDYSMSGQYTDQLLGLDGVGYGVLARIIEGLSEDVLRFADKLNEMFPGTNGDVNELASPMVDKQYTRKVWCFTGQLETLSRQEARAMCERVGNLVTGAISERVHYVVAGRKAGIKLKKAADLGVKVLTEDEFIQIFRK